MQNRYLQEITDVLQSSHINFLFGAGVSHPYLPLLGNIEKKLNEASTEEEREVQYKEYFSKVMLPNINILDETFTSNELEKTKENYYDFFLTLSKVILARKSTLLSKQVNIFTTNIDILMESCLENLHIDYNDGFTGKFTPNFSTANFKKSIFQRSQHYDHISEIPVYNIIKMHGSLTWTKNNNKIEFSHSLNHIDKSLGEKTGTEFKDSYDKILVVNPEENKYLQSVMNLNYYELLRLYSSELEKENATLIVLGFSMADSHIKEITLRAAKSNPTLRVFVCCSKNERAILYQKLEVLQHPNITILAITSENEYKKYAPELEDDIQADTDETNIFFTLPFFSRNILKQIVSPFISTKSEDNEEE